MAAGEHRLPFERPIYEMEDRLAKLGEIAAATPEVRNEIRRVRRELTELKKQIFGNLNPWQTVEVARHPDRPMTADYLELVFEEFIELHGDKFFGDDRAIRAGFAKLDTLKVLIVGHQKGRTTKDRHACSFGCATRRAIESRSPRCTWRRSFTCRSSASSIRRAPIRASGRRSAAKPR